MVIKLILIGLSSLMMYTCNNTGVARKIDSQEKGDKAIKEIENDAVALESRYQEWTKPIDEVVVEGLSKVNQNGYTLADYKRDIKNITEKQREKYDPVLEMDAFFNKLCAAYLSMSQQMRLQIRNIIAGKSGLQSGLVGYASRQAEQIKSKNDSQILRLGLAAISIENCANDFRDVLIALAELYVSAEKVGIDPLPYFNDISTLSSTERPTGGDVSTSEMLRKFYGYAILKERRGEKRR